jgi:hypothetical protein
MGRSIVFAIRASCWPFPNSEPWPPYWAEIASALFTLPGPTKTKNKKHGRDSAAAARVVGGGGGNPATQVIFAG